MDLILFGRQGSGKGTQGKYLAERYNLISFVTGDELRKLAQENSTLGQKVKTIIEAGHLVSNEVVMEIIENFMLKFSENKNVLFDGIPRKPDQAQTFNTLMQRLNRDFIGVIFEISEAMAIKRLTNRRICEKCKTIYPATYEKPNCECGGNLITRTDDGNMESIKTRLTAYENETVPVIENYQAQNKIITINGEQSIDQVNEDTFAQLDPLFL
ncbi:TPA: hypothetical protein DGH83_03225 [Candidatus Peregrinibacteria bacterium]|nr:hypothetical protein [Candidatus Peregrinibacteria bacterium]